jgi:hypothetical protein
VEGVNSSMIYLIDCKNFCKCHNVSPLSTIIEKEGKQKTSASEDGGGKEFLYTVGRNVD